MEKIGFPKVHYTDNAAVFEKEPSLADIALCLEVEIANATGLENGQYGIGSDFYFKKLASGEILAGKIGINAVNEFSVEGILLSDKHTLLIRFTPAFKKYLADNNLQDTFLVAQE